MRCTLDCIFATDSYCTHPEPELAETDCVGGVGPMFECMSYQAQPDGGEEIAGPRY